MRWALLGALLYLLAGNACALPGGIASIERLSPNIAVDDARSMARMDDRDFLATSSTSRLDGAVAGGGWWRVRPTAHAGGERLFVVFHPYSARVTVLSPPDYASDTQSVFDGDLDPRFSRRALVFPLATDGAVYVRVENARYPLQVEVSGTSAYAIADLLHVRLISLVIGVLVGISLVVLLFWLLLRERVYLLYAAAMAMQLLYLLCAYGEAYALPGLRELSRFGAPGVWAVATLATATASFFLIDLAGLAQRTPWLARALRWVGGYASLALLALLLLPWPDDKRWFPPVGNATLLAANVIAILALVVAFWRGERRAGYALVAWVPLVSLSTARAVQLATGAPLMPWIEYGLPVVLAFAAILLVLVLADRILAVRRERDRAQVHAERDALTGSLNRTGIEQRLASAIAAARTERTALFTAFLDLDHFKYVNDSHGHAVGDACLRALVRIAASELQDQDSIGRLGGEEFLLVLRVANRRDARDTVERIRSGVESRCGEIAGVAVGLTVSIGVAEYRAGDDVASMLARSDRAMYAAKHAGRNRVAVDPPTA